MNDEVDPEELVPIEDEGIQVDVKRTVSVVVKARKKTDTHTLKVRSLKTGTKFVIKKNGYGAYYDESLLIPNDLFETVGELFAAVKEAKEREVANNGN